MTNSGVQKSDTNKLFPEDMVKSDDVEDPSAAQLQSDLPKSRYKRVVDFWNIFDGSSHDQPPPWQAQLGFYLSCVYLVASIAIIAYYLRSFSNEGGRPTVVDTKYVSAESVHSGSMNDYICLCNLPPDIKIQVDEDTRSSTFNRCYDPEDPEQVRSVDVLQFVDDFVSVLIEPINTKGIKLRVLDYNYSLYWQSYELQTSGVSPFSTSEENPLANLSSRLTDRGYILDTDGIISVEGLANTPFFTVPQGFIKADVNFTCKNCSECGKELWGPNKYGLENATETHIRTPYDNKDVGWVYCYEASGVSPDAKCQGSCRFFQTQYQPWGIALNTFARTVLLDLIDNPDGTSVSFASRVLYANVSSISTDISNHSISFLEIDPTGTSWAKLVDYFHDIPDCIEEQNEVYICNGVSICQSAAVYSADSVNSESLEVACMNYPMQNHPDKGMNKEECDRIVETLKVTFRVPDQNISELCGAFACEKVKAWQIHWGNWFESRGEVALSSLTLQPSFDSSYIPELCVNNYSQAHVTYEEREGKQGDISAIYEVNCTSGKSRGCWLTGRYKNVTDTVRDDWKWDEFSSDENRSAEQMFACYRFYKESVPRYLLDKIGIIGGNIGNLLLGASCIYWTASKCLDESIKRRPRDSDAGSGRALNETPSTPTAIGDVD